MFYTGSSFGILIIAQIFCAVHVFRRHRPFWWLLIIFFLPVFGCGIYFLVEMLPEMQRSGTTKRLGAELVNIVDPGRSIRRLEEELEVSDTVKNRQSLARGYVRADRFPEAIDLYRRCLTGIYEDDPSIHLELAFANFQAGSFDESKRILIVLKQLDDTYRHRERDLLWARTLEELGDDEEALTAYEAIVPQSSGEEARCRYALLLKKVGRTDEASKLFADVLKRAKRSPRYYRRMQREWISLARKNV